MEQSRYIAVNYPGIFLINSAKPQKPSVRRTGSFTTIQAWYLSNASTLCYCYTKQLNHSSEEFGSNDFILHDTDSSEYAWMSETHKHRIFWTEAA
jgi:hypothetical protein